ncbi:coiled-coil domain-containing protein 86 [Fukomys damarensis]|uniref:coiled-coil domain-containing protein 86 n=1 Tax=Fukomys damarensis TaxID=885580 RepID=UPI0008FEF553|nr:coiled-coil domain-containing protein 86 [Fukomys damarensis]
MDTPLRRSRRLEGLMPEAVENLTSAGRERRALVRFESGPEEGPSDQAPAAKKLKREREEALPVVPRGKPKSGRVWKDRSKKRFSQMVQDKPLRTSWQRKMQERQQRQLARDLARHLEEEKARRRQEKKQRRAENLRRCLENERRAEVVQVIRNPAKLKRAKKKQLRSVQKRDTLSPGGASARRNVARAPASQALGRNPPTRGAESGVPQPQGGNVTPSVPRPGDPGAHAPPRP